MTEVGMDIENQQQCNLEKTNQNVTSVKRASRLVDSIHDLLFYEISKGHVHVEQEEKPLKILSQTIEVKPEQQIPKAKKRSMSVLHSTLDVDQHRQIVKKFIKQNRRSRRKHEMRSVQILEKSKSQQKALQKSRQQQKSKTLGQRRKQIERRMYEKQNLLKEIQKSFVQTNERVKSVRKKKFYYQKKQQQFYKNFVLPKIEEQKQALLKRKQLSQPMDLIDIETHEKMYKQATITQKLNRQLKSRVISQQWTYKPPQFIPKSYKLVEEQQQIKKAEQKVKEKEHFYNQFKRKNFLKALQQMRAAEKQKAERQKSPSIQKEKSQRELVLKPSKVELSRQAKKDLGNSYMQQIKRKLDRTKIKPKRTKQDEENLIKSARKKKNKVQEFQLELIREQRIQKIQKIRFKKVNQIVHNKSATALQKFQQLGIQSQKLDKIASQKKIDSQDVRERSQGASVIINSIHTKLAMMELTSPKN